MSTASVPQWLRLFGALAIVLSSTVTAVAAAPIAQELGGIRVLHGGVGFEEREAMRNAAERYNLQLTFARAGTGAYLAGVRVQIRDATGKTVLDTVASGPWLYAALPDGSYTVSASHNSETLSHQIGIKGAARRDWVFRFKADGS